MTSRSLSMRCRSRKARDSVGDLAGVRVLTYVDADREKVVEVLRSVFHGTDNSLGARREEDKQRAGGYYRATHLDVIVDGHQLAAGQSNIADTVCEIQVSSLLAHAADEIEHDLRYKPTVGELGSEETELLDGSHYHLDPDTLSAHRCFLADLRRGLVPDALVSHLGTVRVD
jgi:ppGpp synthetase/RelA/SpoT-type nucleotidyltranferase